MKLDETKNSLQQLKQEMADAITIRTYQSLAEGNKPHDATERIGVDLGAVVKAQGDTVNTLITQLTNMMTKNQTAAQDVELRQLRDDLKELKASLTSNEDPATVLSRSMDLQDKLVARLKSQLGVSELSLAGGSRTDLSSLTHLKQMDIDAAERARQWQQEREEQKREWEREDQRWAADFGLKREESRDSRKTQERAGEAIEDLAGSIIEGIDKDRGVAGRPRDGAEEAVKTYLPRKRVKKPRSFRCECGATVSLASPEDMEAKCVACGAVYDMVLVQPGALPEAETPPTGGAPSQRAPVGEGTPEQEERA